MPSPTPPTPPVAGVPANYTAPIGIVPLAGLNDGPAGIVCDPVTDSMIVSFDNFGTPGYSFEQIRAGGAPAGFTGSTTFSGTEIDMATAEPGVSTGCRVGDVHA